MNGDFPFPHYLKTALEFSSLYNDPLTRIPQIHQDAILLTFDFVTINNIQFKEFYPVIYFS